MGRFFFLLFGLVLFLRGEAFTYLYENGVHGLREISGSVGFRPEKAGLTPDQVFREPEKLHPLPKTLEEGAYPEGIWTLVTLENRTDAPRRVVLHNPYLLVPVMDVYLYREGEQVRHFVRGSWRDPAL